PDRAPPDVSRREAPVDPRGRVDGAGTPAPAVPGARIEPGSIVKGTPAPGVVRPPGQPRRRVVPAPVVVRRPARIDVGRPDVPAVLLAVAPVAVAVQGSGVVRAVAVDVACRSAARIAGRAEPVFGPDVEAVMGKGSAPDLGLIFTARRQVLARPHFVGSHGRVHFRAARASDD